MSTPTAALLQAGKEDEYVVTTTPQGWIEIRNHPSRQLNPAAQLDFLRIVQEDDAAWTLYQLTANGVLKGEARFSNSLGGYLFTVVANFFESL